MNSISPQKSTSFQQYLPISTNDVSVFLKDQPKHTHYLSRIFHRTCSVYVLDRVSPLRLLRSDVQAALKSKAICISRNQKIGAAFAQAVYNDVASKTAKKIIDELFAEEERVSPPLISTVAEEKQTASALVIPAKQEEHAASTSVVPADQEEHEAIDVVIPAKEEEHAASTLVAPAKQDEHEAIDLVIPAKQEEHAASTLVIPAKEEEHEATVLVVPADQEEHATSTLVVPAEQEEHTATALVVPAEEKKESSPVTVSEEKMDAPAVSVAEKENHDNDTVKNVPKRRRAHKPYTFLENTHQLRSRSKVQSYYQIKG